VGRNNKKLFMMKMKIAFLALIGFLVSCSNPNKVYIEKVKQKVKEDALGVEVNYKSLTFDWTDTLYVREKISEFEKVFGERLNVIIDFEYFVKDNFEKGKIFSKSYLTKSRLEELRNWEKNERGIPFDKEYEDYYAFAFDNRGASAWVSQLCNQIEETDSLLNVYEDIEEGDLSLLKNSLWYYKRIDNFHSKLNPEPQLWAQISDELDFLRETKSKIDSLSAIGADKVIYYKALNMYKINNPFLNGAEQEIKQYFLFDADLNIIGREDFVK